MESLQRAITILGGQVSLATALGVVQSAISGWLKRGRVPIKYCAAIERATAGEVTRRDLRPNDWHDIWPEHEEAERLRGIVAELLERLRRYEPEAVDSYAPIAINSEALHTGQEVTHV